VKSSKNFFHFSSIILINLAFSINSDSLIPSSFFSTGAALPSLNASKAALASVE